MKLLGNFCFYSGSFLLISSIILGSNPYDLESVVLFTALSFFGVVLILTALVCWSYDLG